MSLTVRRAGPQDTEAIVASEADAFPEDAWSWNLVSEGLAGTVPTVSYWVAELDGRVAGHAVTSVVGEDAELQRIATDEEVRGRGVGRRLLDACLGDAAEQGAERVLLEVRETNTAALALYRAAGFTELARRPRYYRDGATAVVLSRPVRMEP